MDTADPGETTELPRRFEHADTDALVILIADMLQRLITHNDQVPLSPEGLTRFHSRTPPAISVLEYLRRIVKYTKVEKACLLITLHYIDQICARYPRFMISSLTVHRFIIASIAVSSKALCDVFCTNSHYAKVGGTRVEELNLLEREFLSFIDWNLTCTRELLQAYYTNLVRTHSVPNAYKVAEASSDSDVEVDDEEAKARSPSRSPSSDSSRASSPADIDANEPTSPATVLKVLHPSGSVTPAAVAPTLEQSAAFAALSSKADSPCAVDVVRREKRAVLGDSVDPAALDSPRPRGRRRIDDS
ncbi:cyclin-domain-containing protein [Exidia glandulosa HHB12029]|uniref:Cyclin-domain-containing protein n=1 Tax=Exidia glandulosa HHB12029 TaxID=1314781 RepID=A0A165E1W6_EXIGL|nr:cyclin-domain-containing protein [Exidia glandulosa HHB12029]